MTKRDQIASTRRLDMSIKISVSQALSEGQSPTRLGEVDGKTVGECLDQLIIKRPDMKRWLFDESGNLKEYVDIFINKQNAFPSPLAKPVKDGDELFIMSLIGGG
jgi:molybdopterin converting factor small subunit